MSFQFTLLNSSKPSVVSKIFSLDEQSNLQKKTSAQISQANCELKSINNLSEFGKFLEGMAINQCLIYGIPPKYVTEIVTKKKWDAAGRPTNQTPRSKSSFIWPNSGGILMLDYDAPKIGQSFSKSELIDFLIKAIPELADVQILAMPSTSSCLYLGEEELVGVKGMRLYILLDEANDIPRVGNLINARLWSIGVGRHEISESGQILERPLFDRSVWETNRIDFCAGACCQNGIQQRRGSPEIINGTRVSFNSSRLDDLTAVELSRIHSIKNKSRAAILDFSFEKKQEWIKSRLKEYRNSSLDFGEAEVQSMVNRALEQRELHGQWLITVKCSDESEQQLTVATVLANPDKYDNCLTLDPLEPNYDSRRFVGKLYLNNAFPNLHSFAHGGNNYRLLGKPVSIEIIEGKESDVTDAVLDVMRHSPDLFDFGDVLVEVTDEMKLKVVREANLRYILGKIVQFHQNKKLKNPPPTICKSIIEITRRLKRLEAVITAPTLRPDGTILFAKGYDETTGLLLNTQAPMVPVSSEPTVKEALKALETLMEPFKDFPFVDELAKSVHLAALLTVVIRPSIPTSPGFAYDAPIQGSGKSLLASCVEVLGSGREPTIWPDVDVRNADEVRKRAFTAIRSGDRTVIWDNVVGEFDSAALAGMMTSRMIKERLFNTQTVLEVPNKTLMIFTGNNFSPVNDMSRRVLICRIDPQIERPQSRSFDLNPKDVCMFDRQRLVSAALTLIRFYLASGIPKVGDTGSFSEWDTYVRQTILHIGRTIAPGEYVDIAKSIELNQAADPEAEILIELYKKWYSIFGSDWVTSRQIIDKIKTIEFDPKAENLGECIRQLVGPNWGSPKALGKALKRRNGRLAASFKLECHEASGDSAKSWRITNKKECK